MVNLSWNYIVKLTHNIKVIITFLTTIFDGIWKTLLYKKKKLKQNIKHYVSSSQRLSPSGGQYLTLIIIKSSWINNGGVREKCHIYLLI